ncbi:MAG: hypothetical protein HRU00_17175 [Myxococcales bacterium]|nr:hypothetical protein [Myxococcales bacterium]
MNLDPTSCRTVDIELHRLFRIAHWRSMEPVRILRQRVNALLGIVGRRHRGAVAGGSVARALLGMDTLTCDLDLFMPGKAFGEVFDLLQLAGATQSPNSESTPSEHRAKLLVPSVGEVDLIQCKSVADAIARFDVRACAVATDGAVLMAVRGALDDLRARELIPMHEIGSMRFKKYTATFGLDPRGFKGDIDIALRQGHPGWIFDPRSDPGRDEILGRNLNIEINIIREAS